MISYLGTVTAETRGGPPTGGEVPNNEKSLSR